MSNRGGSKQGKKKGQGFRVSFADLLEAHLPQNVTAGHAPVPDTRQTRAPRAASSSPPRPAPPSTPPRSQKANDLELRLARAEAEKDRKEQQAKVERARAEAAEREARRFESELLAARKNLVALGALREDNERLELERARLRQQLAESADERSTLEQTCTELQQELIETRDSLEEAQKLSAEHPTVLGDLETARQREVAWRTRALELERAAAQGGDIFRLLKGRGLEALRQQVRVMQALLSDESTALPVLKSIRQIDVSAFEKAIEEKLAPTCADPLCNRTVAAQRRVPLRVDDEAECTTCRGEPDRRWFAHMVQECHRAGVRRLLVIGGSDETQARLRALSAGQSVDLRLVSADEEVHPARAQGRVEGCDALVLWSNWVVATEVSTPYVNAALSAGRPIVNVLGPACAVKAMARATVNRLARTHVLRAV